MAVDVAPYHPKIVLQTLPCNLPLPHFETLPKICSRPGSQPPPWFSALERTSCLVNTSKVISDMTYNADMEMGDAYRVGYSMPYAVTRLVSHKALHMMASMQPERFNALESTGFKTERYGDIMWHILEKVGGHYMDVGCSAKIASGLASLWFFHARIIKVKSDALPTHFTESGLLFSDGSETLADIVVFCAGFVGNMRTIVTQLFGQEVADRVQNFWGLDEEGN